MITFGQYSCVCTDGYYLDMISDTCIGRYFYSYYIYVALQTLTSVLILATVFVILKLQQWAAQLIALIQMAPFFVIVRKDSKYSLILAFAQVHHATIAILELACLPLQILMNV